MPGARRAAWPLTNTSYRSEQKQPLPTNRWSVPVAELGEIHGQYPKRNTRERQKGDDATFLRYRRLDSTPWTGG